MKPMGSVAGVVAAMREDVTAEVERTERDAEAQARRILDQPPPATRDPDADPRVLAARRAVEEMRAREDWDDSSAIIKARERFLHEVVALGRQRLAGAESPDSRRAWLAALAREGAERLAVRETIVEVSPADAPLVAEARPSPAIRGGCVVRARDGKTWFDNTVEERERRFEPEWRALIARSWWP